MLVRPPQTTRAYIFPRGLSWPLTTLYNNAVQDQGSSNSRPAGGHPRRRALRCRAPTQNKVYSHAGATSVHPTVSVQSLRAGIQPGSGGARCCDAATPRRRRRPNASKHGTELQAQCKCPPRQERPPLCSRPGAGASRPVQSSTVDESTTGEHPRPLVLCSGTAAGSAAQSMC